MVEGAPWRPPLAWRPPSRVELTLRSTLLSDSELPMAHDWRSVDGVSYVTSSDEHAHQPRPCGSNGGATAALNDRVKVLRRAEWPDVTLRNCVPGGCNGDAILLYELLKRSAPFNEACGAPTSSSQASARLVGTVFLLWCGIEAAIAPHACVHANSRRVAAS